MAQQEVKFDEFAKSKVVRQLLQVSNPIQYKKFMKKIRMIDDGGLAAQTTETMTKGY